MQFVTSSTAVGRLFNPPFLIETPIYQRSYVWTKSEAGQLFEDLCAAAEVDPAADNGEAAEAVDDFLGTILIVDRDGEAARRPGWPLEGPARTFEVVDGLQRLTTISIILCAHRDAAVANGDKPDPRVLDAIGGRMSGREVAWFRLRPEDEAFFDTYVRQGAGREPPDTLLPPHARMLAVRDMFLKTLREFDREQLARLATFLLNQVHVVLITTSGIDRAHRMFMVLNERGKPLARNDILKADHLARVAPAALARVADAWDTMEKSLGHDFEMLFSHVRAMYAKPNAPIISTIRRLAQPAGGAERFVLEVLKPAAEAFDEMRRSRGERWPEPAEVGRLLSYLNWLPGSDWLPPAMLYWQKVRASSGGMLEFLRALDRYSYALRFLRIGASKRSARYGVLSAAIRNGEDVLRRGGPMSLTGAEERSIRYNMQELYDRAPMLAKLVLLRINDRIAGATQALDHTEWTVEHVLPRKYAPGSQWRAWYEDPGLRSACTESLGNLVIVSKAQNDKAANHEFARKHAIYFQAGVRVLPVTEPLRAAQDWRPEAVLAREAALFEHLDAIWDFGLAAGRAPQVRELLAAAGASRRARR